MSDARDPDVAQSRLSEARAAASSTARAFGLLWAVSPARTLLYTIATLIDALLPATVAWVAKLIVDGVVAGDLKETLTWVGVECGLMVGRSVTYHLLEFWQRQLGARLAIHVNTLILDKALNLSAHHFEDSDFTDRLTRAAKEAGSRPLHLVMHGFGAFRETVRLLSFAVLLISFSGWVVLAILAGTTPQFAAQAWSASELFRVQMQRTFAERRSDYLREILTREHFIKEVKLFALGRFVLRSFLGHQEQFYDQDQRVFRRTLGLTFAARLLATLTFYGCYAWIVTQAVRRAITLGDMTMLLLAVRGSQEGFEAVLSHAAKVYEGNLYMSNLFLYLAQPEDEPWRELDAAVAPGPSATPPTAAPPSVAFESVGFTYPGTDSRALEDVSFTIRPGETLALVGPNGAGKTTLIKLLGRLYEPDAGAIRLGDEIIAGLPPAEVRRRIGVIFQDFVQFHLTARENIGVGWIPEVEDEAQIRAAARSGGADEFLEALPDGYDTMLGRYYGGAQLSIGQWQRIALARAFMRHSDVLVLDEPTAALDAESEAALFERFTELKQGRTAILITHRFSTVRFADRIVVLDRGRVVEQGTHTELLGLGGLYAKMFNLQARGYRLDES
ncbi:MAG: ABC transporter ATP-binding protein [bacterium]